MVLNMYWGKMVGAKWRIHHQTPTVSVFIFTNTMFLLHGKYMSDFMPIFLEKVILPHQLQTRRVRTECACYW